MLLFQLNTNVPLLQSDYSSKMDGIYLQDGLLLLCALYFCICGDCGYMLFMQGSLLLEDVRIFDWIYAVGNISTHSTVYSASA